MIINPCNFPVLELVDIKVGKFSLKIIELWWNFANWSFLERPMTTCKNFSIKFNVVNIVGSSLRLSIVFDCLLRFDYILEHCLHLTDSIVSTLNLQLLNHSLLCTIWHWSLIQKSISEQIGIRWYEDISTMKTAEQLNDCFNFDLNFILTELVESFNKFVVHVECNILRSLVKLIHEVLECHISSFLKSHIILEGIRDHIINFMLKFQKFQSEFDRILL